MNHDTQAEMDMTRARIHMLRNEPFFGVLALRLHLVQRDDLYPPTLATDGETLYYHPEWVRKNSHEVRKSGVAHEVGHCILHHMTRLAERDPERWNQAGDYVINAMLRDAGFRVPETWLYDPAFAGMSTDEVYNRLADSGNQRPRNGQGTFDTIMAPANASKAGVEAQQREWAVAVTQAANSARKAGKMPGSIERFVAQLLSSSVDWRTQLRRFITERTREGYSYQRFNRRMQAMGIYLPGRYSEEMETLVVVTDDSGSISDKVLSAFTGETSAARDAARPRRTIVLSCDARINHVADLTADDPFEVKCHGGGGTDFRPPFEWLQREGITPSCLVYLTDLEGPFPPSPPDYPVLWCSINNKHAPWGETVRLEV